MFDSPEINPILKSAEKSSAEQILQWSSEWLDTGTRIYFTSGAVSYILYLLPTCIKNNPIYNEFNNFFGWIWNYFDALAGLCKRNLFCWKI